MIAAIETTAAIKTVTAIEKEVFAVDVAKVFYKKPEK